MRARTQMALTQSERARAINLESPIESTTQKTTAYLVVRFGAELAEDGVLISEGLRRRHGAHPEQRSTSPIESTCRTGGSTPDWKPAPRARSMVGRSIGAGERAREVARWGGDGRREGVEARRKRKKWWGWTVLPLPSPPPPLRASVASSLLFSTESKLVEQWTTPHFT